MKLSRHIMAQLVAIAAIVALAASPCLAGSISVTGTFSVDNDVFTQMFTVTDPSLVTIESYGYAGGMNAAGAIIASGGFDAILSLFQADGTLLISNDDGSAKAADPVTNQAYDSKIADYFLGAGTYYVSITQYDNLPTGPFPGDPVSLSDPNFTLGFSTSGPSGYFWDSSGAERTGAFAFDIVITPGTTPVPEPGSLALLGMGGLGLGLAGLVRRRNRQ